MPREGEERGKDPSAGAAKGVFVAQALPEPWAHRARHQQWACSAAPCRPHAPALCSQFAGCWGAIQTSRGRGLEHDFLWLFPSWASQFGRLRSCLVTHTMRSFHTLAHPPKRPCTRQRLQWTVQPRSPRFIDGKLRPGAPPGAGKQQAEFSFPEGAES